MTEAKYSNNEIETMSDFHKKKHRDTCCIAPKLTIMKINLYFLQFLTILKHQILKHLLQNAKTVKK